MTAHSRSLRGGSWFNYGSICRSSYRSNRNTDYCNNNIGFRLCARKSEVTKSPRRMLRGGSWFGYDYFCRSSFRYYHGFPDYRRYDIGFRLAGRKQ